MPSGILDGQLHVADASTCKMAWCGKPNGQLFRCALCGHKFEPGDTFRFILTNTPMCIKLGVPGGNPFVCGRCDGPNDEVYANLINAQKEWLDIKQRWWWFIRDVVGEAVREHENDVTGDRHSS